MTAHAAPTDYEAEDAQISQGAVESNHAGFSGRGFVNYTNVAGSYVEWTVSAAQAGTYALTLRYANGTEVNRPVDIRVNGAISASAVAFPGTGAWTTWQTKTVTATLAAGQNKIRATATTAEGGPNADKLTVDGADTEKPTAPTNLRSNGAATPTTVALAWDAARDNVGVVGYDVYQHGQHMKSVTGLSTTIDGLTPNTEYQWTVFAKDAAGNVSAASNEVVIKTPPAQQDTEAPSAPTNLARGTVGPNSVGLQWSPSQDNVGVTGYEILRDGQVAATATGTAGEVGGLSPSTAYKFTVRARDAVGNRSANSNEITVTTAPPGGGGGVEPGRVTTIASNVDVPWGVAFLPEGSALVSERNNFNVFKLTQGGQRTPAGKVPNAVTTGGEGGLLGLEVSPNFASDKWVYIYHSSNQGNRVVRMKYENNALVQSSYQVLLGNIPQSRFHNGGRLRFGPDGMLYVATGDAQAHQNAQDLGSTAGKILRITPDGKVPADNPFAGNPVWSYGHRNVQGLGFDSRGRLWATEFGNSQMDELNLIVKGGNYGWSDCEGTATGLGGGGCDKPGFRRPARTFAPTGSNSPSGLTIVNDHIFVAQTTGERVYRMKINGDGVDTPKAYFQGAYGRLRTVEKSPSGGLWLTTTTDKDGTANNDRIFHIELTGANPRPGQFKLTSSAFADNAMLPAKYTGAGDGKAGQDISPPLSWAPGAAGAKSYAIVLADRVNNGNKRHWAIWDVPIQNAVVANSSANVVLNGRSNASTQ
ncbi:PQQ-dependent sugar dehydrogenase [Allokutzneria sp. A3M-2-11 16]|uniref:PQQ-dependent sugar dehydrogenase n=1 Tax=Allokutzneria sp. A3M-2-11 16 TaxID=2962043 RepID=UPI0020B6FFE4|nr:PQQ-dependent sugar dehydrogenase [Allokutzneria sp. A3M-2-11 16]MCP3802169.1 PQQ-dependent sugar dehydrogenase [Allokutzneria sp. A3M-2-11 16]